MASSPSPLVATGQQIGVGWTPALSVVKALAALAEARRLGGQALYWMADEDHDRLEVARTVAFQGSRLSRHTFRFQAPEGTATGWLAFGPGHQTQAEALWGAVPLSADGTLRGHTLALGAPLWARGILPFSPTRPEVRQPIQEELERWRAMDLESHLVAQAARLEAAGTPLPLDPREQAAWFSLMPSTGLRRRLDRGEALPKGAWLSPGAALRPLMQSLLLPGLEAVVLGPAERAYWRLTEPLWERVGLKAPRILARPSVAVLPPGMRLAADQLESLHQGRWEAFHQAPGLLPSQGLGDPPPDPAWGPALSRRFEDEMARVRNRLLRLDRRFHRDRAARSLGMDPEGARQHLFPLGRPQERVLPGLFWLRDGALLDRMLDALESPAMMILLETP